MNIGKKLSRYVRLAMLCVTFSILPGEFCLAQQKTTADNVVVFPSPPDTARIQFLRSYSTSTDVTGRPSFFRRYILGIEPEKPILKPYGIAVAPGKIYICDTMLPGLEIIDLPNNKFDYFTPTGMGQLKKPVNCTVDENGRLYVADTERDQVVIFGTDEKFISAIGFEQPSKPTDVKVENNKIWICDLGAHRIRVVDRDSEKEIFSFPEPVKNKPDYLFSPTNITILNNILYVTDTGDARVKLFSLQGNYVGAIGSFGKQPGQFVRPKGIAADSTGNIYVVDAAFENVQLFNEKRQLLMYFGGHSENPGYMWLPAGLAIDSENLDYFQKYLFPEYNLKHLIFVTNQYGPAKINVYGFIEPKNDKAK